LGGWSSRPARDRTRLLDGTRVKHSPSCHGAVPWPQRPEEVEFAMRPYEVMVIFDPDTDERQVQPTLEQHLNVVTKAGGTVNSLEVWGRRRLAYEIRKKSEGIYVVLNVTAQPADVKELDRQFTLNESIMRTKVLRADAH
jgi:small subunit ribosomal protein S6